jgi:acetylornithine deacetylase
VRANVGVLKFRLRPAHPLQPEAGRSAIDLMVEVIDHLRVLEKK